MEFLSHPIYKTAIDYAKEKGYTQIVELLSKVPKSSKKEPNPTNDQDIFIDDEEEKKHFINAGQIGEGGTSITYKIICNQTNQVLCKKVIKNREGSSLFKDAKRAILEFEIMHKLNHPCICKSLYINIAEPIEGSDNTTIAIFLEFIDHSLKDLLKKKSMSNTEKARITLEIAHGMNFLHKKGLIHRDLKVENIMLNSSFETKIVDFGLVKITEEYYDGFSFVEDSLTKGVGTLSYMSPEMANEDEYDAKTDVYSFGIVLYYIFVGSLPEQKLRDKMNGKKIELPSPSDSISKFCIDLISECLSFEPSNRPSFEEILNQIRKNSFNLASCVDSSVLSKRDKELDSFNK